MIKINLLRNMAAAGNSVETLSNEVKTQALLRLAVILLLPVLLYFYERVSLAELEDNLAKVTSEVAVVEAEKGKFGDAGPRFERYTKEKARIDQEMGIVRGLAKNRLREVKVFDALQSLVNNMQVRTWLTKIKVEGALVKIYGFTATEEGVSDLIRALENSAWFSHVDPKSTNSETIGGSAVKSFELDLRFGKE